MKAKEHELRLKRLRHRSRQRGFAEADELFIAFARDHLETLTKAQLQAYEQLLSVPDWDSFGWIVGQSESPTELSEIVEIMRKNILRP